MPRKCHPNQQIEAAVAHAEMNGWRITTSRGRSHAWGTMRCPNNDTSCRCGEFCITSIWSTPRNPGNHARQLRRIVDNCTSKGHCDESE
ncbi:MAG: hypothetical protein AB2L09_12995 [Coriobacteriia bacterium]